MAEAIIARIAGGDTNLMAYVGNNPVTGIDPEGLCASTALDFISNGQVQPILFIGGGILGILGGIAALDAPGVGVAVGPKMIAAGIQAIQS